MGIRIIKVIINPLTIYCAILQGTREHPLLRVRGRRELCRALRSPKRPLPAGKHRQQARCGRDGLLQTEDAGVERMRGQRVLSKGEEYVDLSLAQPQSRGSHGSYRFRRGLHVPISERIVNAWKQ